MESRYTLMFQKGETVVNSFTQWGIVCCKVPFKAGGKTKELSKQDWHDQQPRRREQRQRLHRRRHTEQLKNLLNAYNVDLVLFLVLQIETM